MHVPETYSPFQLCQKISVKACRVLFHPQNDMYPASSSIIVYARVICAEGLHFSALYYRM